MSDAGCAEFWGWLKGWTVRDRVERHEDGDAGPRIFLCWKGDQSICRGSSLPSSPARFAFEDLCVRLEKALQAKDRPGASPLRGGSSAGQFTDALQKHIDEF